jgi:hypothetical protein
VGACGRLGVRRKDGGQRGGIRVIYYLATETFIYLITAYAKNKQETLTAKQLAMISEHVKKEIL